MSWRWMGKHLCPGPRESTQPKWTPLIKITWKYFIFFPNFSGILYLFKVYSMVIWYSYCKITIKFINTSITSHSYLLLNRKNAEDLVSQQISHVQHSIINCSLHAVIQSSELAHLTSERLYPCTLFSLCLSHLQQLF